MIYLIDQSLKTSIKLSDLLVQLSILLYGLILELKQTNKETLTSTLKMSFTFHLFTTYLLDLILFFDMLWILKQRLSLDTLGSSLDCLGVD